MVRSLWRDVEEPRQEMDDIMNMFCVLGAHRDIKDGIFNTHEPCTGVRKPSSAAWNGLHLYGASAAGVCFLNMHTTARVCCKRWPQTMHKRKTHCKTAFGIPF